MTQQTFRRTALSSLLAGLTALPSGVFGQDTQTVAAWEGVPDQVLEGLRGGVDLGLLTGDFSIGRVVRVDGQEIVRTEIVFRDIGRILQGGLPDLQVLGNLANLIQIGPANVAQGVATAQEAAAAATATASAAVNQANAATRSALTNVPAAASMATSPQAAAAQIPASLGNAGGMSTGGQQMAPAAQASAAQVQPSSAAATPASPTTSAVGIGNSGVTSSANISASSPAQFGAAIEQAVAVATGEATLPRPAPVATPTPTSTPTPAPAAAPAAASSQTASAAAAAAQAVAVPTRTIAIPVGNTGQTIVVSNIPNAAPLTTAIQNSVTAQIQTQTYINATMEQSLASLRSGALAAMIRQQAIQSIGR